MEYRKLPHGEEQISVLGLGSSSVGQAGEGEIAKAAEMALDHGINFFDLASGDDRPFPVYGQVFAGCRDQVLYQLHFGADYTTGEYGWTSSLERIKASVDWQLKALKTDYIDFGFIHCIDETADLEHFEKDGVLEYIQSLKAQGVVRHIGLSSHTPETASRVLDMGILDMLMFSINPAYDYQKGDYGIGQADERMALYRRCEKEGVGISVMKAFAGGQLLQERTSPFGKALTEYQCIQYALDRPGVLTVLPGIRSCRDLERLLGFFQASAQERDYSIIGSFAPKEIKGACVYCNHCQPCPQGLNIGLINKYYDLAKAGDHLAADHYRKLEIKASACIQCGHCDSRCPFQAPQGARMEEIRAYFGE